MSKYTVYETLTKELTVDADELKSYFQDEWAYTLEYGFQEEDFIRGIIDDYGLSYIEECLEDGPYSKVDAELSIVHE